MSARQFLGSRGIQIEYHHSIAGAREVARHRRAHRTNADKSDHFIRGCHKLPI
jgi:hypothetical protein